MGFRIIDHHRPDSVEPYRKVIAHSFMWLHHRDVYEEIRCHLRGHLEGVGFLFSVQFHPFPGNDGSRILDADQSLGPGGGRNMHGDGLSDIIGLLVGRE